MTTQYGLDSDGNVTTDRAEVAVVDGHAEMFSRDGDRWARHVYGPGGAEMHCAESDVPGSVRAAITRVPTVDLGAVEPVNESSAVARGKAVLDALEGADAVMLDTDGTDGDEAAWSEMTTYLARRGVAVAYDHDAGYPVARTEVV